MQTNARMLSAKLREADARALAAESEMEGNKKEMKASADRLKEVEATLEAQQHESKSIIRELEKKLSAASVSSPVQSKPSMAPSASPESEPQPCPLAQTLSFNHPLSDSWQLQCLFCQQPF